VIGQDHLGLSYKVNVQQALLCYSNIHSSWSSTYDI